MAAVSACYCAPLGVWKVFAPSDLVNFETQDLPSATTGCRAFLQSVTFVACRFCHSGGKNSLVWRAIALAAKLKRKHEGAEAQVECSVLSAQGSVLCYLRYAQAEGDSVPSHGLKDEVISVEKSKEAYSLLKQCGANVDLHLHNNRHRIPGSLINIIGKVINK